MALTMQQNTPEWDIWRAGGLGASAAPVIMGTCPYQTLLQLWEEKVHGKKKDEKKDFIYEKGHRMEIKARALYEITEGVSMSTNLMEFGQWNVARCSMDGFNKELKQGIEIKYVGAEEFKCIRDEKRIPANKKHFYAQIQHQYMVSGAVEIELVAYNDKANAIAILPIPCDVEFIKKMLIAEKEFWQSVQDKKKPELSEADAKKVTNKELKELFSKYAKAHVKLKESETKVKALRGDILSFLENNPEEDHERLAGTSLKISTSTKEGAIDYKKALDIMGSTYQIDQIDFSEFKKMVDFEGAFKKCATRYRGHGIDLDQFKSPDKTTKTFKVNVKKSTAKKPKQAKAK